MQRAAYLLLFCTLSPAIAQGPTETPAASLTEIRNRMSRDDEAGARLMVNQLLASPDNDESVRAAWGLQEDAQAQLTTHKARAVSLQIWAVELWKKAIGPESLEAGLGTQRLAEVYRAAGDSENADSEYRAALRILEVAKGPGHPSLAGALRSYAEFLVSSADPANAEPVILRLLEMKELQAGADSPILADDLGLYEKLLRRLGRDAAADKVAARRAALLEIKKKHQPGSPSFRLPRLLNKVEPQYTALARTAKANASAKLAMIVDEQGNPRRIWVMNWAGLGLDEQALDAVRQWKFEPAQRDGKPVLMHAVVEVNFRIL